MCMDESCLLVFVIWRWRSICSKRDIICMFILFADLKWCNMQFLADEFEILILNMYLQLPDVSNCFINMVYYSIFVSSKGITIATEIKLFMQFNLLFHVFYTWCCFFIALMIGQLDLFTNKCRSKGMATGLHSFSIS